MVNTNSHWFGKKHKQESKEKMSKSMQGKQDGEKNSQYGTKWITDGTVNKRIKVEDVIPEGWKKGRVFGQEFIEKTTKLNQDESRKLKGEKNPAYGKSPITDGVNNKRLKHGEPMPEGWRFGQTKKKVD